MNFTERILQVQSDRESLLCIGLDADPSLLPPSLGTSTQAILRFNGSIIEHTADLVCAYKINLAFYEALGTEGWNVLCSTLDTIPKNVITIGDGKRNDIGNSARRYADALFGEYDFDAVTVNPFMGGDSVEPFLQDGSRGAFILSLTSNPGSRDFQRLKVGSTPLYKKVVSSAKKWNLKSNVGLVVGATHPKELREIRGMVPSMPILIPGIGKQGGDLKGSVRYGCNKTGKGAIINVGRSVLYASKGPDFAGAARREAMKLRDEIRKHVNDFF